ncbi:hypothetical protein ACIQRS_03565 [Streptomyces termitum]|uniref:Uncharacterized protein n=1 Tax=Streptomyces termitum TaxID=67368 RepID=A0A918T4B3_9ACTN|nr:hypothetical protein [Streptomyces termitum]GHA88214.1 hypothetical protein GCM10010305_34790 [Streptomyces termitum]
MRTPAAGDYNGPMTVFFCSRCGTGITPELTALAAVPEVFADGRDRDRKTRRAPSTVPRGHYAIDPDPWARSGRRAPEPDRPRGPRVHRADGPAAPADPRHTVLLHPDDAPALRPLPGNRNGTGCCGPSGDEGPNRACPCGTPIATPAADCLGPYELHLDPVRTHAFSPEPGHDPM